MANIIRSNGPNLNPDEEVIRKRGRKVVPKIPKNKTEVALRRSPRKLVQNNSRANDNEQSLNQSSTFSPSSISTATTTARSQHHQSGQTATPTPTQSHEYNLRTPTKSPKRASVGRTPTKPKTPSKSSQTSSSQRISPRKRLLMNISGDSGIGLTPANTSFESNKGSNSSTPKTSRRLSGRGSTGLYRLRSSKIKS